MSSNKSKAKVLEKSKKNLHGAKDQEHHRVRGVDESGSEWEGFEDHKVQEQGRPVGSGDIHTGDNAKPKKLKSDRRKERRETVANNQEKLVGTTFQLLDKSDERQNGEDGDISAWKHLNLCPETLSSLARLKFSSPTPVQISALPHILAGHDAICKAPTGSGKTLAFGIPIYQHYCTTVKPNVPLSAGNDQIRKYSPIALILSPTRELAHQLSNHLSELSESSQPRPPAIVSLTGGLSLHKQLRLLENADIVIATPGRLWEVMQGNQDFAESLKRITFLVLDEADRLLSTGHFQELEKILNALDRTDDNDDENEQEGSEPLRREQRQTLVFSATFQKDFQQRLAGKSKSSSGNGGQQESMEYLLQKINFKESKPKFIDVNPVSQMATGLDEGILECAGMEKVCLAMKRLCIIHHRIQADNYRTYTSTPYSSATPTHAP